MLNNGSAFDAIAATALAGLVWESTKAYRDTAPSIRDLRSNGSNEPRLLQELIDADITVGIPVLIGGAIAAYLMRSWLPILIVVIALTATAGYHHSILSDPIMKG